jgi:predicted lipid-binding transport protein (Tim44 family)
MFASRGFRLASLLACVVMAFSMISVDQAEARRGGSFGSRGTHTYQSAPATNTSPTMTGPVQRSMTPAPTNTAPRPGTQANAQRGMFGGFGGSMLSGLVFGGLLGLMFGHGFGGAAGLFGLLVQILLAVFVIRFLMRSFGRQPAAAGRPMGNTGYAPVSPGRNSTGLGSGMGRRGAPRNRDELGMKSVDLDRFQAMLIEVQAAFGREDYAALRQLTTPEMMSYLSEELGENASRGLKNEVSQVKLIKGDVAESWREGNVEYATTAMRYAAVDATIERATGRVVEGDAAEPTETTELWTFVRRGGENWKLSAIQEA